MAQGRASLGTDEICETKAIGTRLVYCSCLLSASHLAAFTAVSPVPSPAGRTDKVTIKQQGRPEVKWTRRAGNAVQIGRELKGRQRRGRSSHQYDPADRSCHCADTQRTNYQC